MSFDAGAITGSLELNTGGFVSGMLSAESLASLFPSVVTAFIADPLLGAAEVAKEAASAIVDAIKEIGHAADEMGESAEKAGVSVEFLTGIGAAFKDAGSSVEGLGDSMKFLNRNAAEAAEGGETAVDAFTKIGLSADFVKSNLGNSEAIFFAVADAISSLPTAAEKTRAAMELLGRGGSDAIAALNKGSAGLKSFAGDIAALGGTIDGDLAAAGDKFGSLEVMVDAAWTGIKKAVAQPVLEYFAAHFEEIKGSLVAASEQIRGVLGGVGDQVAGMIPGLISFGGALVGQVVEGFKTWGPFLGSTIELVGSLASLVSSVLSPALRLLAPVFDVISTAMKFLADTITALVEGITGMIRAVTDLFGLTSSATGGAAPAGANADDFAAGRPQGGGGTTIQKVEVHMPPFDVDDASSSIAKKIVKPLKDGLREQQVQFESAGKAAYVSENL